MSAPPCNANLMEVKKSSVWGEWLVYDFRHRFPLWIVSYKKLTAMTMPVRCRPNAVGSEEKTQRIISYRGCQNAKFGAK